MRASPEVNEISKALALAQGQIQPANKSAVNPFFKSKYADLSSIMEAIRGPLSSNGICVLQDACAAEGTVSITTGLYHSSGQWIEFGPLTISIAKKDAQGVAAGITYAKRIALQAALGVTADEDDDGNEASGKNKPAAEPEKTQALSNAIASYPRSNDLLKYVLSHWKISDLSKMPAEEIENAITFVKAELEKVKK